MDDGAEKLNEEKAQLFHHCCKTTILKPEKQAGHADGCGISMHKGAQMTTKN